MTQGSILLPSELLVSDDALGQTYAAEIDGASLQFALPQVGGEIPDHLRMPDGYEALQVLTRNELGSWGYKTNSNESSSTWAVVEMAFTCEGATPGNFLAFEAWFRNAREWVCAAKRLPLEIISGGHTEYRLVREGARQGLVVPQTRSLVVGLIGGSRSDIESAFQRASRGDRAPLQHRLLLEAASALVVRDWRRAVIDAGSAAEVALAAVITKKLSAANFPPDAIRLAIKNMNGVDRLLEVCLAIGDLGDVSLGRTRSKLAGPRNLAAHAGVEPTPEAARDAIHCAREIVQAATPLDFP